MAVDDSAFDRLRDDLLAAIRHAIRESEDRVRGEMASSAAETRRHMDVVAEDLKAKIALVAEGVVTLTERLGGEMREGFDIVDRRLLRLETRLLSAPERG